MSVLEAAAYMPHGYCLFWQPWLIALHAGADLLISVSYFAIPLALIVFLRRRPDIRYRHLVALFAAFILLCGLTHVLSIVTLWSPIYVLEGLLKLLTGVVSATTAVVLFLLIPKLVEIPSPHQLEEANAKLRGEITAHEETLAQLREAHRDMEAKIADRTADLSAANARLSIMGDELVHRSANLLSVVSAIASATARGKENVESFLSVFLGRIRALSEATSALTARSTGAYSSVDQVVRGQLEPMVEAYGDRIVIEGPEVEVGTEGAQQLALAVYELATNAVKYGALSTLSGTVWASWSVSKDHLIFDWQEKGRATALEGEMPHSSSGFGTQLLTRAIPGTLHGTARRRLQENGLHYELVVPIDQIGPDGSRRRR